MCKTRRTAKKLSYLRPPEVFALLILYKHQSIYLSAFNFNEKKSFLSGSQSTRKRQQKSEKQLILRVHAHILRRIISTCLSNGSGVLIHVLFKKDRGVAHVIGSDETITWVHWRPMYRIPVYYTQWLPFRTNKFQLNHFLVHVVFVSVNQWCLLYMPSFVIKNIETPFVKPFTVLFTLYCLLDAD